MNRSVRRSEFPLNFSMTKHPNSRSHSRVVPRQIERPIFCQYCRYIERPRLAAAPPRACFSAHHPTAGPNGYLVTVQRCGSRRNTVASNPLGKVLVRFFLVSFPHSASASSCSGSAVFGFSRTADLRACSSLHARVARLKSLLSLIAIDQGEKPWLEVPRL